MSGLDPADWVLRRYPPTSDRSLRAFDAADQLALSHIASAIEPGIRVVVVNDAFGGLAVPLTAAGALVTLWTDSALAMRAVADNLAANDLRPLSAAVRSTDVPTGPVDVAIVKVPKALALLEAQLVGLRGSVDGASQIVGAGMVKHIHTSTLEIFEGAIGPTVTSLAKKKARLIHPSLNDGLTPSASPPVRYSTDEGVVCVTRANVFSHRKLDIGTRLLLANLGDVADGSAVVDLGCGNGVLGTTIAQRFDRGSVTFCDASFAATSSAKDTWVANHGTDDRARFITGDLADGVADASVDLVLINPPFHDQHVVGDETARRMFVEARRILRDGGEVRVIGNRHLGYHKRLRSIFGNLDTVASDPKFVVFSARKAPR